MKNFITIFAAWLASCLLIGNLLITHVITITPWVT